MTKRGAITFTLSLILIGLAAFACGGEEEKDCWRGYKFNDDNEYVKDKLFCDDCCRVCSNSQACGDACIPRSSTCHVGVGCACNKL